MVAHARLGRPRGSRPNAGTCTENVNVSSHVNPSTNVEYNDRDDQEDYISCFENEVINEGNSSNVDSVCGLDDYFKL